MSRYLLLLSSEAISPANWRGFLTGVGAELIDKLHNPYDACIVGGEDKIWLQMDNGQLEDIDAEDLGLIGPLGGEQQTLIVIELSNTPGSRALAEEVARRFGELWRAILEDVESEAL